MFEFLNDAPYGVVLEAVYQVMRRLYQRAPHQDFNDGFAPGAKKTPENQAVRSILREIRETEGCRISELSDEAAKRYTRLLSDVLESRSPRPSPADVERALATLEEMRRKYGRAA
jgi:hypothetical protein